MLFSARLLDGEAGIRHSSGGAPEEEQPWDRPAHRGLRDDAAGDRHEGGGMDGHEKERPMNYYYFSYLKPILLQDFLKLVPHDQKSRKRLEGCDILQLQCLMFAFRI